jgi:UDP-glucose-4-epimerase GalE
MVLGGAGYIGSSVSYFMKQSGREVVIVDNLSSGFRELAENTGCPLIVADLKDAKSIDRVIREVKPEVVMHFAASQGVPQSIAQPSEFYNNNISATINLMDAMVAHGVKHLIFSSTAASYGIPEYTPIDEKHRLKPTTPYGWTKIMMEQAMHDYAKAYDFNYFALRYFNAAGDIPDAPVGEMHDPESHLIPNILLSILKKDGRIFEVYGDKYETTDGTCIRDYIHVEDLARAHAAAADHLRAGGASGITNLGCGAGNSVLEVLDACRKATGRDIPHVVKDPRPGDPPVLIASHALARDTLKWEPEWTSIDKVVDSAWHWHSRVHAEV